MTVTLTLDGETWPGDYHAALVSATGGKPSRLVVRSTTPCSRELITGWHRWVGAAVSHRFVLESQDQSQEGRVRWHAYEVHPWEDPQLFEYRVEFAVL